MPGAVSVKACGSFSKIMKEGITCMSDAVLIAIITLGGSSLGSLCGIIISSRLTTYRIEQLEKKVDKHNTVIERTYKLEQAQAVQEEQIKVANNRIKDLEEREKVIL
jgi:predicted acylesterase/phospholipase RssA